MKLSANFTLEEMLYSSTAEARGIKNTMFDTTTCVANLTGLCQKVLQPIRNHFGPLIVTSGYSCVALAQVLGRKASSQHCKGEAADLQLRNGSNYEMAKWIRDNLEFDQLIYESRRRNGKIYDWVHISYKLDGTNRNQVLNSPVTLGYLNGLPEKSYVV